MIIYKEKKRMGVTLIISLITAMSDSVRALRQECSPFSWSQYIQLCPLNITERLKNNFQRFCQGTVVQWPLKLISNKEQLRLQGIDCYGNSYEVSLRQSKKQSEMSQTAYEPKKCYLFVIRLIDITYPCQATHQNHMTTKYEFSCKIEAETPRDRNYSINQTLTLNVFGQQYGLAARFSPYFFFKSGFQGNTFHFIVRIIHATVFPGKERCSAEWEVDPEPEANLHHSNNDRVLFLVSPKIPEDVVTKVHENDSLYNLSTSFPFIYFL